MKLFYPNLAFEDELTSGSNKAKSASAKAVSELAPLMAWAGDEHSLCVVPELPDGMAKSCVGQCVVSVDNNSNAVVPKFQPWGWTQPAIQFANSNSSVSFDAPDLAAVRKVNSRSFLNGFDAAVGLRDGRRHQFSCLCESFDQVSDAVQRLQADGWAKWVAKPELSHAGRNRLLMTGLEFNDQQAGWLRRHFRRDEAVSVEPWVAVEREGSLHFEIPLDADHAIQEIGITGLLNDSAGRYRGSFRPLGLPSYEGCEDLKQSLLDHGRDICQQIRGAGYWGPVGLDFFVYENSTCQPFLRLCNDLNARWTMGRLSLEVADRVGATGAFRWEHFITGNSEILDRAIEKGLAETGEQSVDILRTSPDHVGGRNVRLGNVAIWAPASQDADCQSVAILAQQIRLSLQDLLSEKSSQ